MRNGFVASVIFIILLNMWLVSAEFNFDVEISPQSASIKSNQVAEFDLKITHNSKREETFDLFSPDIVWDLRTANNLVVPTGKEGRKTKLYVKPLYINSGYYSVPINIRLSRTGLVKKQNLLIEVSSVSKPQYGYSPAVKGTASISYEVDPREDAVITVYLENQNVLNVSRVDVKLRSALINKDHSTSIEPLQKKTVTFKAQLDPLTKPQQDLLKISLFSFDKEGKSYQYDLVSISYEIKKYGDVKTEIKKEGGFLRKITTIVVQNSGNAEVTEHASLQMGLLGRIFTRSELKAQKEKGTLVWKLTLQPGETKNIEVVTNYWYLVVIILLGSLGIAAYFLLRSPLLLEKRARILSTKEGGLSELKVLLYVKNRSKHKIKSVNIIDIVPKLAEFLKHGEPGTVEPGTILMHDKKGTIVKWHLPELDVEEERIISYRIKSSLSIIGGVSLPVAVAKFHTKDMERTTKSNIASVTF